MAKAPDFASAIPKLEKNVNDIVAMLKKHAGAQKKKRTEFDTMRVALLEGRKAIEETHKQLEAEKDTFEKMVKKIDPILSQMILMSKEAGDLKGELQGLDTEVDKITKALNDAGSDVKDQKKFAAALKQLEKTLSEALQEAKDLASEASDLREIPQLPKL